MVVAIPCGWRATRYDALRDQSLSRSQGPVGPEPTHRLLGVRVVFCHQKEDNGATIALCAFQLSGTFLQFPGHDYEMATDVC